MTLYHQAADMLPAIIAELSRRERIDDAAMGEK